MQLNHTKIRHSIVFSKFNTLACIIFILCLFSCDNASDQMVNQTNPNRQFNVEELIQALNIDTLDFTENVVLVEGSIKEINYLNNRKTIILRGEENRNSSIICDMQEDQAKLLDSLKTGQVISIKGILKGSLKDVILLNCKISNQAN